METFYLIDFENVHNEGLENIECLTKENHVHIFSTENASMIKMDVFNLSKKMDIQTHIVPIRKQSLDMHLVSYLGYLLGIQGKQCSCVIISKDTDYDNIIKFWQEKGYQNICRKRKISENLRMERKTALQTTAVIQTANSRVSAGMADDFSGKDRSKLNLFMQHGLIEMGYSGSAANRICKCVVAHCNDEHKLREIHNDLRNEYGEDYLEVYQDVKLIFDKFVASKSNNKTKEEARIRSFFGQHFKKKIYVDNREAIISIILNAQTRQQVNNQLLKLYSDGNIVKHVYQKVQPLIKDLPGK